MILSAPSKTFLIGEYAVLFSGEALVMTHQPLFKLQVNKTGTEPLQGIAAQSPAGKLYQDHHPLFAHDYLEFNDPHLGQGGLGASSAQFALLLSLISQRTQRQFNADEILESYWQYAFDGEGVKPSGADLLAQTQHGLCHYQAKGHSLNTFDWPFHQLGIALVHTQEKLKTHEHLKALTIDDISPLHSLSQAIGTVIKAGDDNAWITLVNHYAKELKALNLVAPHSVSIQQTVSELPGVLACKGCGAMGADIVLICYELEHEGQLFDELRAHPWPIIATHHELLATNTSPLMSLEMSSS